MREQQHRRQDQRAERVDMAERIEADPSELRGRVVAETLRDEGVRGFVEVMASTSGSTQTERSYKEMFTDRRSRLCPRPCSRPS
jgi:hypothetical protein